MSTPVNASPASFRTQTHDSEPKWCATPFLCGSLIRYSMPVYPGASLITLSALTCTLPDWGNDKSKGAGFTAPLFLDGISKATDNMIRELILTEA